MSNEQRTFWDDEFEDDLEAKRLARRTDPVTSHEAAKTINPSRLEIQAARLVSEHPGSTGQELEQIAGWQVHKRLDGAERKGLLKRGGARRCRITGRNVLTWWPV